MVFDPVDQVRKQSELEVSRPVQFFLLQIPLTAQAEILAVKPLGGLHHWDAMIGVILLRNGDVHFSPFLPAGVLHQLLDLAFEIAGNGDAFFDHGGYLHYHSRSIWVYILLGSLSVKLVNESVGSVSGITFKISST